jgi:hypothetical protein
MASDRAATRLLDEQEVIVADVLDNMPRFGRARREAVDRLRDVALLALTEGHPPKRAVPVPGVVQDVTPLLVPGVERVLV